jgi:hypothetical protein
MDGNMATGKPDNDALPYLYGDDGWPLGGPSDAVIARVAEARAKRDMQAALDRLQGGDLSAFTEAMWLCWRHDPDAVPYRLVEASEVLVERAMLAAGKMAKRPGGSGARPRKNDRVSKKPDLPTLASQGVDKNLAEDERREQRERRAWDIHLARWEEMVELLERGPELSRASKANLERARGLIAKATDRKKRARLVELLPALVEAASDDRGTSVERASVAVAKVRKETDARGRARKVKGRTVRASYELVERLGGKAASFESYRREVQRRRGGKRD